MARPYFESTTTSETIDTSTGELLHTETTKNSFLVRSVGEPSFVKLYIDDLGKLLRLQHKAMLVLFEMVKIMDYKNEVSISIGKKKEICKTLEIYNTINGVKELATNVVDQHITKLVKADMLFRKDKGMYIVNACLFGKGAWSNIKNIRLEFEYDKDGRKMKAEIEKELKP